MIGVLIKKQMMEVFSWLYQDRKTGKHRSKRKLILYGILYTGIFGMVAFTFFFLAIYLCPPLSEAGYSWLYIVMMSLMSMTLGIFGSVFNTYATVYRAKDNDLLLAMPIPVRTILIGRLSGMFVMGLFYEVLIMVPSIGVYFYYARVPVWGKIFSVLLILLLAAATLGISCILGWLVALASDRLKNQKIVTVLISLVFLGIYYYICGNIGTAMQEFVTNPQVYAKRIRGMFHVAYLAGKGAEGDVPSMLMFTGCVLLFLLIVYLLMRKNFLRLATSQHGEKKAVYVEKKVSAASAERALLRKELRRFLGSSTYMLNCGLGMVFSIVIAVMIVIKRAALLEIIEEFHGMTGDLVYAVIALALCTVLTMCDISAPSVSLEGKSLWLTRVLPVSSYQILLAKRNLHIYLVLPPALVMTIAFLWLQPFSEFWILTPMIVIVFIIMTATLGVVLNLRHPNFSWTTEVTPIKQSASVTIALFGSWGIVILMGALGYLLTKVMEPVNVMVVMLILLALFSRYLNYWLKTKGVRIFESLC